MSRSYGTDIVPPVRAISEAQGSMAKVLVLEDDLLTGLLVKTLLEDEGHTVTHIPDSDQPRILEEQYDVLISDWGVEGAISPVELARKLRVRNPSTVVIFISGYPREEIESHVSDLKGCLIYTKPTNYERVVKDLANCLRVCQ